MRHSRASTMDPEGAIERRRRQKRSLGATIQGSAHRAFAEVRRTSGMCQDRTFVIEPLTLCRRADPQKL
jgi:hypothetical protein